MAQTAFREVTEHMMEISKASDHSIQKKIQSLLNDNNIDNNLKNKIMSVFKEESLSDLYSKINTRHKLHKFVKENFDFIQIQELKRDGECVGHYMSIKETLTSILKDPTFKICRPKSDLIKYHTDTLRYKNSLYLQENPEAITINIYSDSVSLTNPLGASKRHHNITHFYFGVNEMELWMQSSITHIFNICFIQNNKVGKDFGFIHTKIVQELKQLENGFKVGDKFYKVALLNYIGDNLEIHSVLGMQCHFNAGYVCRLCTIQHKELNEIDVEPVIRDQNMYKTVLSMLKNEEDEEDEHSADDIQFIEIDNDEIACTENDNPITEDTEFENVDSEPEDEDDEENADNAECEARTQNLGWIKPCPYMALKGFDVLNGFPFDILHDCMEGVFSYDIPIILKWFVKNKKLKLEHLNNRLKSFKFSPQEQKDKPVLFLKPNFRRLPGKGMASSLLVKILPYLLQPLIEINESCKMWNLLKLLHRLREIILAEQLDVSTVMELEELIDKYFQLRKEVVLNKSDQEKPKHHNLKHLPDAILQFGPPVLTWTARYVWNIS